MFDLNRAGRDAAQGRLFGLDHLRALAITLVFLFHYGRLFPHPDWVFDISKFGWTGVDLFFVLSGYLISSQLFSSIARRASFSYRTFFIKRFFRIIPAYLVVVGLYFLFPILREREGLTDLWRYLTFTQNFGLDLRSFGTFSHAWSLCIEEQFYFFLPLTLLLLVSLKKVNKGYLILIALFIVGFILRLYSWNSLVEPLINTDGFGLAWYKWIYYPTYCRLDGLVAGVSIAALFQFAPNVRRWIESRGNIFLIVSICLMTGAYFLCLDEFTFEATIFGFPLVALGYACLVIAAISPTCFLYMIRSRVTAAVAGLSYGIYLVHKMTIHSTQALFSRLDFESDRSVVFLACITTSILAAWILRKIIEKPMLQARDNILLRKKVATYS
jgi:peptidoglycan/LPS O-acetylase OafA/YrhL